MSKLGCCTLRQLPSAFSSSITAVRFFLKCQDTRERVPADEVIGVEFDNGWHNHIKEFLNADIF